MDSWNHEQHKADSRFAPSQWETALFCNEVFHWLGASLESALTTYVLSSFQAMVSVLHTACTEFVFHLSFYSLCICAFAGFCIFTETKLSSCWLTTLWSLSASKDHCVHQRLSLTVTKIRNKLLMSFMVYSDVYRSFIPNKTTFTEYCLTGNLKSTE